jgi:hypothetical protein
MRRKPKHLFTLAYARSKSTTVALQALRFSIEYGRFVDVVNDDDVSIEAFASHVGISRAQAFRRQQAYRQCFPNQDVLDLWERVVRPALDKSAFKSEPPAAQSVFAGTLTIELS